MEGNDREEEAEEGALTRADMATPLPGAPEAAVMYCKTGADATAKARFATLAIFSVPTILFFAPS